MAGAVSIASLALFCGAAIYWDVRHGRIPNLLNAAAILCGLLIGFVGNGTGGLASSIAGSLLGLSILLVPFLLKMVGGGDVKFLAAAGALVGWRILWMSFLAGAAIGGVAGIVLIIFRDKTLAKLKRRLILIQEGQWGSPVSTPSQGKANRSDVHMPYAVPLSIGLLLVTSICFFA